MHHLLHMCHVYMEGRGAPSATRVPCAMEVRTKCRHWSCRSHFGNFLVHRAHCQTAAVWLHDALCVKHTYNMYTTYTYGLRQSQ
jgi:hypothetical protein